MFTCFRLEFKLSALGEKKNCLKAQLEHLTHEMADQEQKASRMETVLHDYEKQNHELEERELELRYKIKMLENSIPALMGWNMARMIMTMQAQTSAIQGLQGTLPQGTHMGGPLPIGVAPLSSEEEELHLKLQALEQRLDTENKLLQDSRNAEEALRNKIHDLEMILESKDTNILHILGRDPKGDIAAFEKLSEMANERLELNRKIEDLETKQKMYQETFHQMDRMFSEMEGNYTKQLQEKDEQLYVKENQLAESEFKSHQNVQLNEINLQLQDKLSHMEQEILRLTDTLKKREAERLRLEEDEKRLNVELLESLAELDALKKEIQGPMKGQMEVQRRKTASLEQELEKAQNEKLTLEAEHQNEVLTAHPNTSEHPTGPSAPGQMSSPAPATGYTSDRTQALTHGVIHTFIYLFMAVLASGIF